MLSRSQKHILIKFFSLFSVVRGYNILVVVVAQYLASIYIFASDLPISTVIFDINLLMLVLASSASIAAGYIINSFYDSEKDLINRPQKTMIDRLVSQNTKLSFYFILNFLAVVFASYVSFRAVVFFAFYIFSIWLYSHKLKKIPLLGNIFSALLTVTPFFAIFIYYRNFNEDIFFHATFLFLLLSIREMVKDLENLQGDFTQNYQTIPVKFGVRVSKSIISIFVFLTIIPAVILITSYNLGYMYVYFYLSMVLLVIALIVLWMSNSKQQFWWLHNLLKFVIVLGVLCIVLIDIDALLKKII
ncbi:ubiquinone biosynthesis protein UbiA [Paucihalobacter ruber]|uniref:Ubiquinone biosynthesis protein UbiA n=1 Tax=Paucihalobacter ruber TaxID=2567861 RepID=A0A506PEN8_9FLAO|nr:geranylgeranylglycerol-phosphate geranylgeranyltransferase [Paucihalobacter ruber]TPV31865.1 ubiquinone biosynthesis protein UbiA [Paucihalobacter ruber]